MDILIRISIAAGIVGIGFLAGPFFKKAIIRLSKNVNDLGALTFVGSCASILTKMVSVVIALSSLGVDTNVIVGAFSAMGLGISLALKDSMANVAGGIQILFTHPFVVGDYILVENKEGTVQRIEMMYTVLKTANYQEVVIPNSTLVNDVLVNYSKDEKRRIFFSFPISIDANIEAAKALCFEVLRSDPGVLKEDPMDVTLESMSERSALIGIYAWSKREDYWDTLHRLNEEIQKKRLEKNIRSSYESVSCLDQA